MFTRLSDNSIKKGGREKSTKGRVQGPKVVRRKTSQRFIL